MLLYVGSLYVRSSLCLASTPPGTYGEGARGDRNPLQFLRDPNGRTPAVGTLSRRLRRRRRRGDGDQNFFFFFICNRAEWAGCSWLSR